MKWFKCLVLASMVLVFACGVHAGSVFYQADGTTDYYVTFKTMAQGFAVLASDEDITVYAYVGTTAIDTFSVEAGRSMFLYCPCNKLYIDRTSSTPVTVNPTYNNQINPSFGSSAGSKIVDTDWILITDGYHTAIGSTFAFLPLQPVGDHNLISLQVSYATADTIWVEVLCSNSMMDSLTAFDFGTSSAHVYSKRFIRTVMGATETSPAGFTAGVSTYTVAVPFSFIVQDIAGYPGLPQFVGVRVRAGTVAITALKIVLGLSTTSTCGGE